MDEFDPFHAIVTMNSKAYDEGVEEGVKDGQKAAIRTGFQMGQKIAFNMCAELGQYSGCCRTWKLENSENERATKLATQIIELIEQLNVGACHRDGFMASVEHVRDKFKQFCSVTQQRNYYNKQSLASIKLSF